MDSSENFKKQEILKKEIIDKNLDKDSFLDYCIQKKENGDDLNNWTIEELEITIKEFAKLDEENNKKETEKIKKKKVIKTQIDEDDNLKEIDDQSEIYEEVSRNEKYVEKEITCKKIEKNILNDKNIETFVRNPKIIEAGFLGVNYVIYEVYTKNFEWLVKRRYSDFESLRNILIKLYPGIILPPIPNKKVGSRRFEEDFIEKRRNSLQKFVNLILKNEVLKSCEFVYVFFQQQDRNTFESKIKEFTNMQPPLYIEDIKTFDGKIKIVDDEDNEKYYRNISRYLNVQNGIFLRMNEAFKNFINNYSAAMENLEELEYDFHSLKKLNLKVSMNEEVTRTYDNYNVFFKNWKRIGCKQLNHMKTYIKDFFKNIRNEYCVFNDIVKMRDDMKTRYNSEMLKLNCKKEKLWASMDFSKWEMNENEKIDRNVLSKDKNYAFKKMCFKESNLLNNSHNKLGYYNKMVIDELKRMIHSHVLRYIQEIKTFSEEFYPTLTDGINVWSYLVTNI